MSKAIAVLVADVHYNINTLEVADAAMRLAIAKANELGVGVIVAGDLHDTKANLRAECINLMMETFNLANRWPHILRGNHDQISEKSVEHSLNFLSVYALIADATIAIGRGGVNITMIPYQHDADRCRQIIADTSKDHILIMHQGLTKSNAGHYYSDHSAINPEDVAGRRVISGHYHTRQVIALPDNGLWTYLGNPYTLNFGEANDSLKGFHILDDEGGLLFVPTNLRKHVILNYEYDKGVFYKGSPDHPPISEEDLIWVKVSGTKEALAHVSKETFLSKIHIEQSFKFDLIPYETKSTKVEKNTSPNVLLDAIIDSLENASDDQKVRLKNLWKSL